MSAANNAVWFASIPPDVNVPSTLERGKPNRPANVTTMCRSASTAKGLWLQAASCGLNAATRASAAIPIVDVRDIAAVACSVLIENGHEGKTYTITGPEALTYGQMGEKIGAATGTPVRHVEVPPETARAGMLAACEDRAPVQQRPLVLVQQVVGPLHGVAQSLMALQPPPRTDQ